MKKGSEICVLCCNAKAAKGFLYCYRCKEAVYNPEQPGISRHIAPNKIDNYLWLGPQFSAVDKDALARLKIKHILRLGTFPSLPQFDGIDYLEIKLEDNDKENISTSFESTNQFISKAVALKEDVLVHCQAGISRSSTIVIAYIMATKKITLKDAIEFVRKNRPSVTPNEGFMTQLQEYEVKLGLTNPKQKGKLKRLCIIQ